MRTRSWLLAFLSCGVLVTLAVLFADQRVALQMNRSFYNTGIFRSNFVVFSCIEAGGIALFVIALALVALRGRRLTGWMLQLVSATAAGIAALIVAELLKMALGRTPVYPTFLVDHVSALRPLHPGNFPSGTTASVTATMTVAWANWPSGRLVWGSVGILTPIMILMTNSHWLSDVIAGAFLGWVFGIIVPGIILRRLPQPAGLGGTAPRTRAG